MKCHELALAGDVGAIKLWLDRVVPTLKPVDNWRGLEGGAGATLIEQVRSAREAVMRGEVDPAAGISLVRLLALESGLSGEGGLISAEAVIKLLNREEEAHD